MSQLSRRQFLAGATATAAAVALAAPHVHAQKPGGTLRFVAQADLKILDPVWTTAYITRNHAYLVYDTLFGTDEKLQVKPQMVEQAQRVEGRHEVHVHPARRPQVARRPAVVAEDCVESLKRWRRRTASVGSWPPTPPRWRPVDRKTFTLELGEKFGPVLEALGKPSSNVPFMMPARLAATSADEQIKEIVGSGPFRFVKDEWQPGNQVVYVKNADYVPAQRGAERLGRRQAGRPWTRSSGATSPTRPPRRPRWRRARSTGGRSRRSTSSRRSSRTPRWRRSCPTRSAPRAGSGRTTCTRPSTTRRPGRRSSP